MPSSIIAAQATKHNVLRLGALAVSLMASVLLLWLLTPVSQAATVNDSYITASTLASTSTTVGGATTYTITFTTNATIPANDYVNVYVSSTTGCNSDDYNNCQANFKNASVSGPTGSVENREYGSFSWKVTTALAAGTHTLTVSNVTNPKSAAAIRASVSTGASNEETLLGKDYSSNNWYTTVSADVVNVGTVLVSGTVTGGGVVKPDLWVQVHNANWSVSGGGSTDSKGYYAVFTDYAPTQWAAGEYTANVYPGESSGYINTEEKFTYSGTPVSKNIILSVAEYFFAGKVTYGDQKSTTVSAAAGDPVTNATVCFNTQSGGSSYCDSTDEAGAYSVPVKAGTYSVYVSPSVNWENPEELENIDWHYESEYNKTYSISAKGTQTVNLQVEATTSVVNGTLTIPNSTELIDGSINFTNQDGQYYGSVQDNAFTVNMNPGTYDVWFSPDMYQNSDWGKYSHKATTTIAAGKNTYNFTVDTLTAQVNVTVSTSAGTAVEGVQVNAWTQDHNTGTQTDANGKATMYIAADTLYEVNIWDEDYLLDSAPVRVNVAAGKSTDVNFTVKLPDATVTATIVNAKGEVPSELNGWLGCETKNHQKHYGANLQNGTAEVGVSVDSATGVFKGMCNLWLPNPEDGVAEAQEVEVALGGNASVTFTLQELDATVNVNVKNFATGKKIDADSNLRVFLSSFGNNLWHEGKLSSNPVAIQVLADKPYSGNLWSEGGTSKYIPLWNMNNNTVTVQSGQTGNMVLNVLEKDGTLKLNVKQPNGDPVEYGWGWCGNWEEVNLGLDGVATEAVIDSGGEIRNGVAEISLVSGHTYQCSVGMPPEFVEKGWMSPEQQEVEFTSKSTTLPTLTYQFKEADATLQGTVSLSASAQAKGIKGVSDLDAVWCWAWAEGGNSWTETEPGKDYRLNVDTAHTEWEAGCDAVSGNTWYFTEEPYQFTPAKGKNSHNFVLKEMGAWQIFDPINETFDSSESKVLGYGDGTTVTIPAGTLATSGNVTVRATPEKNIVRTDDKPLMVPIDWEAFDENDNLIETFPGGSVTIEIPYSDEALEEFGVDEDALIGEYYDENSGTWKTPDNVVVNKDDNTITITTDHFTQYGVTYNGRIGEAETPSVPSIDIRSVTSRSVKLALRTDDSSVRATKFVVEVRKAGTKAKANWVNATIKNGKDKQRVQGTVQKLKSKTKYEVRAKACTTAGCSSVSEWKTFTTK